MNKASLRFLKDMVEFNHPLFLLYQSIFHNSVLQVARASSVLTLHIGSQILLTHMVEFNHVLFLLYLTPFHNYALQVVQASSVLTARLNSIIMLYQNLFS